MKILFAAAEAMPFVKTGGLADVVGSLTQELARAGMDVRVVLPKYQDIPEDFLDQMVFKESFTVQVGWRKQYCGILELMHQDVTYYFLDNEYYFKRPELYGYGDDGERFSFYCRAVLDSLPVTGFRPDIIHCHDWHSGMIPALVRADRKNRLYQDIRSVFTIHNLHYQGVFPVSVLTELLGLGWEHFHLDGVEYHGNISFMKAGINYSDRITTVSPRYAEEIQQPYYGEGLDGLLRKHGQHLDGILNGIDTTIWNPAHDSMIESPYDAENLAGKQTNKKALQAELSLPVERSTPIVALISRLAAQKGLDLVTDVFDDMLAEGVQFVVLGKGEHHFKQFFAGKQQQYPQQVATHFGFDEGLAHRIYAGADMLLMPSLFEPCGLSQMIALRYGTIPLVRETGGLADTVHSYDERTLEGNGFSFANFDACDMLYTLRRALHFFASPPVWRRLVQQGMAEDFSWKRSAQRYLALYEQLV